MALCRRNSLYAAGIECIVAYPNSRTCASAHRNDHRTCRHSAAALKNLGPHMLLPRQRETDTSHEIRAARSSERVQRLVSNMLAVSRVA